ncbi:MAG: DEAD/DEAH box helicase [Gammaproteobacteria bacterium]|nr:DEAD/DEAH box helicase [Gammaproteobacteria bacterium]
MAFELDYDSEWVTVRPRQRRGLRRLLEQRRRGVDAMAEADREVACALAEVRMASEEDPDAVRIADDAVRMPHRVAAALDGRSASALGLPPVVDLTFRTDVEGALGTPSFQLRHWWLKFGRVQKPKRVGTILETDDGNRRLPLWLLDAVEVAEGFEAGTDLAAHWEALARFRRALDPGVEMAADVDAARVSMTDFLQGLEVRLADGFGIAPKNGSDGSLDFDPVPFSGQSLEGVAEEDVAEAHSELRGDTLRRFQERVRMRGSLPAYRVGDGSYLVVDRSAQTALDVMSRKQRAEPAQREAFVRNPRTAIAAATARRLRETGELDGLSPEGEEETIEAKAGPAFVETVEYSGRVIGTRVYENPELDMPAGLRTTWLPESLRAAAEALEGMDEQALDGLVEEVRKAVDEGRETVVVGGVEFPADEASLEGIESLQRIRKEDDSEAGVGEGATDDEPDIGRGPVILDTKQNFSNLGWQPELAPRDGHLAEGVPAGVVAALKDHQREGLEWQKECWTVGLAGALNADEQGLGKTLQTITFLRAVQDRQAGRRATNSFPVLVVAPTSLLPTWEAEVTRHTDQDGLGHVIRLYGSGLGGYRASGVDGVDTESGEAKLDLGMLEEAIAEGRGHRFWMLTTYTTLTNYHHSLGRIPFAVAVFDEIQALKNPASLRSFAARAIRGDFRIGLTGTPIENRTSDLWALMDQLVPGALGTLKEFNDEYSEPDQGKMTELHGRVFLPTSGLPQLAMRRTKEQVAEQLPQKSRRLHPRLMPESQVAAYDAARLKVTRGRGGLKALHHIRSVSVHPELALRETGSDFVRDSARIDATFDVIRNVRERGERALVFIEHRFVQYQFVEVARREFGLPKIDIINGNTPITQRQLIVERFQRHLDEDGGFDLLVLGTRAAGTGLTLTAATHVIHVSRWWNPAVEEQCNDRVHRIGQERAVTVHVPMAVHPAYREHSFDCLLHSLMSRKRKLADSALWPMGDTESDVEGLKKGMVREPGDGGDASGADPVATALLATFARDGKPAPVFEADGSVEYE